MADDAAGLPGGSGEEVSSFVRCLVASAFDAWRRRPNPIV